ncbi:MAG: hypothetical protein U1E27_14190 [Kiritimatiellia bacterium]|nr:hypothetical protein [Kiritimatiellia bacterium]
MSPQETDPKAQRHQSAWLEWRRRCSLARCSPETSRFLRNFARDRFNLFCRRYAAFPPPSGDHPLTPEAADCWHLFETHLEVRHKRDGKRYKQWLAERVRGTEGRPSSIWTRGATLLMRDVVRAYLASEGPQPGTISLQTPISSSSDWQLGDLLPAEADPVDEAAQREFDRMAEEEAARHWPTLERRERIAFAARELDLSMDHPSIIRAARCRKSTLYALYQSALERVALALRDDFRSEDAGAILILARRVLRRLAERSLEWILSEQPQGFQIETDKAAV